MSRLAIIGSGDLGAQIAHLARSSSHLEPIGFFDDFVNVGEIRHGLPVIGGVSDVGKCFRDGQFDSLLMGIGYKHLEFRCQLFDELHEEIPFAVLIHPSSFVDATCKLGPGVVIYAGCTLDMNVELAGNVLVNAGCVIAHDTRVGHGTFMSPGVSLAGFVDIKPKVILGIGTVVIDSIVIESGVRTAAGAVVTKSLATPGLYAGVPATLKKL